MTDFDFTAIFKTEVSGQIKRITDLALTLEKSGEAASREAGVLEDLMREFHTIKGAARAIQYEEIKDAAHAIEDIYHAILEDKLALRLPDLTDLSLFAVDLINSQLEARIAGQPLAENETLSELAQDYLDGKVLEISARAAIETSTETKPETSEPTAGASTKMDKAIDIDQKQELDRRQGSVLDPMAYEELTDSLMGLSGELAIAVDSTGNQRLMMQRLSTRIGTLQREMVNMQSSMAEPMRAAGLDMYTERFSHLVDGLRQLSREQVKMNDFMEQTDSRLQFISDDLDGEVNRARMVAISQLTDTYPRVVRDLSQELGKKIMFKSSGETARLDRAVLDAIRAPMMHILRNAIDHGIEPPDERETQGKPAQGTISMEIVPLGGQVNIIVSDDGRGMEMDQIRRKVLKRQDATEETWSSLSDNERIQFLFLPGFSTSKQVTDTSGRGFGMDIVKTEIEKVGGHVDLSFEKGKGMQMSLTLPLSLSLTRCLMVAVGTHPIFGTQHVVFPLNEIDDVHRIREQDIHQLEGRDTVDVKGETLPFYHLADLMQLQSKRKAIMDQHLILIGEGEQRCGLLVDQVIDERDIVVRNFDQRLGKIRDFQAITLLVDGGVALVADVRDILESVAASPRMASLSAVVDPEATDDFHSAHILVVEDSVTVREVERHMLEEAGYQVTTAVNGMDGLNKLRGEHFDLIISDIDMPRMNGIEMIKRVRKHDRHANVPIIVVSYKDREEDRTLAMEAGTNHYVTKAAFDSGEILSKIHSLLPLPVRQE